MSQQDLNLHKPVTHQWRECSDENYWVESDPELSSSYLTVICMPCETYDDKTREVIFEQFVYLYDNCPYGWGALADYGAKFMVIEKPARDERRPASVD